MKIKKKKTQFRSKKKKERTQYLTLPQELVNEILLRLPVKSLIRFKVVCKSWFSLISNPQFARSHFDLGFARTQRLVLLPEPSRDILSVDFNAPLICNDSATEAVRFEVPPPRPYPHLRVLGSCRGFILLYSWPDLYIWNPCTRVYRQISGMYCDPDNSPFIPSLFGFGYDPSTDDYLVIIAFTDAGGEYEFEKTFSCRANTWKEWKGNPLSNTFSASYRECNVGLFFNDAIHWFASRDRAFILVFDLIERVLFEISLPNDFDCDIDYCQLQEIGGCLSICAPRESRNVGGIWVMEEYKMQSSWTRSHTVMPPHGDFLIPICVTKSGDVIGTDDYTELVKFNERGEVLEHHDYDDGVETECDVVMHIESLLSLHCDS